MSTTQELLAAKAEIDRLTDDVLVLEQQLTVANERYEALVGRIAALCEAEERRVREINERLIAERGPHPLRKDRWLVGGILSVKDVRALLESA